MAYLTKGITVSLVVACALTGVLGWFVVKRAQSQAGYTAYYDPVYSPDGQYVYFVERRTNAKVKKTSDAGLFFEGAKFDVAVANDTFSLKRLQVQSGEVQDLIHLAPSPLEGQHYEAIGTPFHVAAAQLKFIKGKQLEFSVCLTVHQVPMAREYLSAGVWSEAQPDAGVSHFWKESYCQLGGTNEWSLYGDSELMEVQGRAFSPIAIVAYNHVTNAIKVLVKNADYDREYPDGVPLEQIIKLSHRSAIEHTQAMLRTHEELLEKYKAMGMGENQALLQTGKDMERLGYYPKTTTIVARRLNHEEAARANIDKNALFTIAKDEMESGTFHDLEQAIAKPGEEIDKDYGYPIHRDYTTSAQLNAYIATGKMQFYVRYLGQTYELTIKRP
jgi:hypothetical protein